MMRGIRFERLGMNVLKMGFLNANDLMVNDAPGIKVISSGCGAGKTTIIKKLIKSSSSEGVLYSAATIRECNEMYDWLIKNAVGQEDILGIELTADDIISIHSEPRYNDKGEVDNGVDLDLWNNNPMKLKDKKIIICTHYKLFHEYPSLLIGYNLDNPYYTTDILDEFEKLRFRIPDGGKLRNPRRYVLIDEFPRCGVLKMDFDVNLIRQLGMNVCNMQYNPITRMEESVPFTTRYEDFRLMRIQYNMFEKMFSELRIPGTDNEPTEFKKNMILSDIHYNFYKYINSGLDKIKVSYNLLSLDNGYSRVIVFEGTGDLLYSRLNNRIKLYDIYPKYSSRVTYIKLKSFIERSNLINTEEDKINLMRNLDLSIDELITTVFNRSDVRKVLIVTWKNLKSGDSNDDKNLFSSSINENFSLTEYITNKLTGRIGDKEFSIIHYQSGLDRATNEFREFDSIVFLGKFQIPDYAVYELNEDLGSDCTPRRYLLHQLVQAVCRTKIRNHKMEDINVFYTGDWNQRTINDLITYISGPEYLPKVNIDDLGLKNKWKTSILKLIEYDPNVYSALRNKEEYNFSIDIDELYEMMPVYEKKVKYYNSLSKYLKEVGINLNIITRSNNKGSLNPRG